MVAPCGLSLNLTLDRGWRDTRIFHPAKLRLHHLQGEFLEFPELVHKIVVVLDILAKAYPVVPSVTGAHHRSFEWGRRETQRVGRDQIPDGR